MISRSFSVSEFFAAVDDMSYEQAIAAAKLEPKAADSLSSRIKGAVAAREQGSGHYADVIRKYLFCLQTGTKPGDLSNRHFFQSKHSRWESASPVSASLLCWSYTKRATERSLLSTA